MIKVTKRSGKLDNLDIGEIQKKTEKYTKDLPGTSQSELEVDARIQFQDGIRTDDIQHIIIQTAVDKIDIDRPNWTYVAARGFLDDMYHSVARRLGGTRGVTYPHMNSYLKITEEEGRFLPGLKEKFNIEKLNDSIDTERDSLFTYLGIKTLYDRYILKNKAGEAIELPQFLFMGVSMFIAQNETEASSMNYVHNAWKDLAGNPLEAVSVPTEKELLEKYEGEELKREVRTIWAKLFYEIMSKFEVMAATPTLSNARTPRHQLSSCYITSTPDNIEGIFDTLKEHALLSKFGGGIGSDWNLIRGMGGYIDNNKNAAGGLIPFLKIDNDVAVAVDQLGTRKGAIAIYIEPWHSDLRDFLDLKKNSGEERRRAHDLFPALWLNDIFMQRVEDNAEWTLMDPAEVPDLANLYGEEFTKRYEEYEKDESLEFKETVMAKEIWKQILTQYFETGNPFLCNKDAANRANPNKHVGFIRSTNLCTEIFQNTKPNHYVVRVEFTDGSLQDFEEHEMVTTDVGVVKFAKKITALDTLGGKSIFFIEKVSQDGETAVCNLASVNLSKINTRDDFKRVIPIANRLLDNVIDINFYPTRKTKTTNLKSRAVGLGVMGEAQLLAESAIHWGTKAHMNKIDEIMETFSYEMIKSSSEIAKEKGSYPNFEGSDWSKGIFPMDHANEKTLELTDRPLSCDWKALKDSVAKNGMRNGYLMAIAPTSSISILVGTTQAIEPVYKRKWFEENLSGLIPVCAPNLNPDTWVYYEPAFEMDQLNLIKAGAIRQKWLDQGQSLNIFMSLKKASGKVLNDIYMAAWKFGLKSNYYLRSESPEENKETAPKAVDRSQECSGCQ